ncbi:hypothetical protein OPV22_017657 [Ensete ventricosum]|uniref:Uncharacterized protein n=1 Tax=Ensete ventricosum TaxID=4639 RepID=A0AAV8R1H4_ENSVE|nr:hypothetical protein OPV22_017657 [Ensete ventricosum]
MRQGKTLTEEATVQQGSGGEPKQRSRNHSCVRGDLAGSMLWKQRAEMRQGMRLGSARATAATGGGWSPNQRLRLGCLPSVVSRLVASDAVEAAGL